MPCQAVAAAHFQDRNCVFNLGRSAHSRRPVPNVRTVMNSTVRLRMRPTLRSTPPVFQLFAPCRALWLKHWRSGVDLAMRGAAWLQWCARRAGANGHRRA